MKFVFAKFLQRIKRKIDLIQNEIFIMSYRLITFKCRKFSE